MIIRSEQVFTVRMRLIEHEIVSSYNYLHRDPAPTFRHLCLIVRNAFYAQPAETQQQFISVAEWAEKCFLRDVIFDLKLSAYEILADFCGKHLPQEYYQYCAPTERSINKAFYFIRGYVRRALREVDFVA